MVDSKPALPARRISQRSASNSICRRSRPLRQWPVIMSNQRMPRERPTPARTQPPMMLIQTLSVEVNERFDFGLKGERLHAPGAAGEERLDHGKGNGRADE